MEYGVLLFWGHWNAHSNSKRNWSECYFTISEDSSSTMFRMFCPARTCSAWLLVEAASAETALKAVAAPSLVANMAPASQYQHDPSQSVARCQAAARTCASSLASRLEQPVNSRGPALFWIVLRGHRWDDSWMILGCFLEIYECPSHESLPCWWHHTPPIGQIHVWNC